MKKYDNFCSALDNMKDIYNYEEPYDNVVLTGLVGLYEITFEQSWKMMKDEGLWLSALQERNNVTHSYNHKIAMGIVAQTKEKFYKMVCELKDEIEKVWL